ncbi:MAG: FliH/SctL family protein [Candidatus Manganitrophaceae bacterium]
MPSSKIVRPGEISPYRLQEVFPANPNGLENGSAAGQIGGKLSEIEREAYERGFASGERAGREFGLKQMEGSHQVLTRLITELQEITHAALLEAEKEILRIALAVARRILREEQGQTVNLPPDRVMRYIREAVEKMNRIGTLVIHLHPQDLERLRQERDRVTEWTKGIEWLQFEADATLRPGECVVESQHEIVDFRIDSQLSTIEEAIREGTPKNG